MYIHEGEILKMPTNFKVVFVVFMIWHMVRNLSGNFVTIRAVHCDNIFSTLQVEAIATRLSEVMAVERGYINMLYF